MEILHNLKEVHEQADALQEPQETGVVTPGPVTNIATALLAVAYVWGLVKAILKLFKLILPRKKEALQHFIDQMDAIFGVTKIIDDGN